MFSSDKNIESIAALVEESKKWVVLRAQCARLSTVDKVVRIVSAFTLGAVIAITLFMAVICISLSVGAVLSELLGSAALGYLAVGIFYILVLVIVVLMRHAWIERPLVKFLVSVLADEEGAATTEESK